MLEAKKPRISGKAVWTWITVIAFVGLLIGIVAYATNPDGSVTIHKDTNGDSHVWGLGEYISYTATCSWNCGGDDCETYFDNTAGLSQPPSFIDNEAFVEGYKSTTGTYTLEAECPADGEHGEPSQTFKVVDIVSLSVDGDSKTNGATVDIEKAATGVVTVTATLTPTATVSELRSGFMNWIKADGNLNFTSTDQLTITVPKTDRGSITLQVQAGEEDGTVWTLTINIVTENTDGSVEIFPPPSQEGKDVWGVNENVSYNAECSSCAGGDNTGFDEPACLTPSEDDYDNDSTTDASATVAETGTYMLGAECPLDASHGEPSRTFKVVDIDYLSVDEAQQENETTVYIPRTLNDELTVTATLTPGTTVSELRPDFMTWTKTPASTLDFTLSDQLTVTVSTGMFGWITIQAKAGDNGTVKTITIVIIDVAIDEPGGWFTVDTEVGTLLQLNSTPYGDWGGIFSWSKASGPHDVTFYSSDDQDPYFKADEPGEYTVKVVYSIGDANVEDTSEIIYVVGVDSLQYDPGHGSYVNCPAQPSYMAVGKGVTYTFKALREPSARPWPDGSPYWGGVATGNGTETKEVTFSTASSTPTDYKVVTAKTFYQNPAVGVNVQVVDIAALDINSKRTSAPTESYYAVKADEHYEIGGTFSFQLDLGSWTQPIDLKYELWDTDLIDELLAYGTGNVFSHTFASGDSGDVIVRFYIDANGNGEYDSGEPHHTTSEFWVQECEEYSIDVQYSDLIGTLTKATVQSKFTEAANVLLKKDSANDWRACVKFTVDDFAQFTSTGNDTGDHPDYCSVTNQTLCAKHYDLADVTFLDDLYGAGGACWGYDWHKVIIDWSTTSWLHRAIAHEHGHGVGLDHAGHVSPQLMHAAYLNVGDTELLEADVDNYDGN